MYKQVKFMRNEQNLCIERIDQWRPMGVRSDATSARMHNPTSFFSLDNYPSEVRYE